MQKIDERRKRWRRDGSRRHETPHPSTSTFHGGGGHSRLASAMSQNAPQRGGGGGGGTFLNRFLRPRKKNQFSLLNSLWFAVGSLMQQGSDVIPRAAATRTVAVIWCVQTLQFIQAWIFFIIFINRTWQFEI